METKSETSTDTASALIKALDGTVNEDDGAAKYTCSKCGNRKTRVSPFYGCLVRCPECGNKWQVY